MFLFVMSHLRRLTCLLYLLFQLVICSRSSSHKFLTSYNVIVWVHWISWLCQVWYLLRPVSYLICQVWYLLYQIWYLIWQVCYLICLVWYLICQVWYRMCKVWCHLCQVLYFLCEVWYAKSDSRMSSLISHRKLCRSDSSHSYVYAQTVVTINIICWLKHI